MALSDGDVLLVRALAGADAVRDYGGHTNPNRWLRMQHLGAAGVPLRVGGDEATRKTGERLLAEVEAAGLVRVSRVSRTKFPHVELTGKGDARAREVCDLPGRAEGRVFVAYLCEVSVEYEASATGVRWVPESRFHPIEDRVGLSRLELDYCAAAAAGWVDATSTYAGLAIYAAAASGLAEVAEPSRPPRVGRLPRPDPEAAALYRVECDSALAALHTTRLGSPGEIGPTPALDYFPRVGEEVAGE